MENLPNNITTSASINIYDENSIITSSGPINIYNSVSASCCPEGRVQRDQLVVDKVVSVTHAVMTEDCLKKGYPELFIDNVTKKQLLLDKLLMIQLLSVRNICT